MDSARIFSRLQFIFRLRGTIVLKIWKQLLFIILYTAAIVVLQVYIPFLRMKFQMSLIPILGTVIGFFLVFRSNTAYARYWEGRCIWSSMTLYIRTITRLIWVGAKEPTVFEVIEKKTAINILIAFAYATKNYLREEYSYEQNDIKDLIKHLPKLSDKIDENGKKQGSKPDELNYKAHDLVTSTNIPLELSLHLQAYIESLRARDLCDVTLLKNMTSALGNMMCCFTSFERILRTPIPLAYSVHLHQAVWLYLLALPYQLIANLNWWTIPAVGLASFSLLGILEIGWEIENPFGYDDNDLPLDDFCKVLKREIHIITGNEIPHAETWLWSPDNQPFLPISPLSADELAEKPIGELRTLLSENIQKTARTTFLSYEHLDKEGTDQKYISTSSCKLKNESTNV